MHFDYKTENICSKLISMEIITRGRRSTSCGNQLAKAVRVAKVAWDEAQEG